MQMHLYIYTTHIYTCMGNKKEHVSNHLLFLHPLKHHSAHWASDFFAAPDTAETKDQAKTKSVHGSFGGKKTCSCCVLPCKGQQNSSKTLSSLCLCSSTSLIFPGIFPTHKSLFSFTIFFQVQFQSLFFLLFFYYLFSGTLQVTIFFTVFLLINYFMVSRGWLKSPFTILYVACQVSCWKAVILSCVLR